MLRHELRLLRTDVQALVVLVAMPLVVMAFLKPTVRAQLVSEGYSGASGAELAVPGMAVMFAFFAVGYVGYGFFREHNWGTWERLRASPAPLVQILAGKLGAPLAVVAAQLAVLFAAGGWLYDLRVRGSVAGLALVALALALSVVALGAALFAVCRSFQQLNAIANLGAVLLAGFGGALVSTSTLPGWAQAVAPGTPGYWAMRGFRSTILDGRGIESALLPAAVLLAFAAGLACLAALRFGVEDRKVYLG